MLLLLREMCRQVIAYCARFPATLTRQHACANHSFIGHLSFAVRALCYTALLVDPFYRQWKYNSAITEYFVELQSTSKIKRSELERRQESTEKATQLERHMHVILTMLSLVLQTYTTEGSGDDGLSGLASMATVATTSN